MKYGINCWFSPSVRFTLSNIFLNSWNSENGGLRMMSSTRLHVCSGATFRRPDTWREISSRLYRRLASSVSGMPVRCIDRS